MKTVRYRAKNQEEPTTPPTTGDTGVEGEAPGSTPSPRARKPHDPPPANTHWLFKPLPKPWRET